MSRKKLWSCLISCMLLLGISGACLAANPAPDPAQKQAALKQNLDPLVTNKVITPNQETAIIEAIKAAHTGQTAANAKTADPSNNPIQKLVKDGVITQEQATAVQKALPKHPTQSTNK